MKLSKTRGNSAPLQTENVKKAELMNENEASSSKKRSQQIFIPQRIWDYCIKINIDIMWHLVRKPCFI